MKGMCCCFKINHLRLGNLQINLLLTVLDSWKSKIKVPASDKGLLVSSHGVRQKGKKVELISSSSFIKAHNPAHGAESQLLTSWKTQLFSTIGINFNVIFGGNTKP
jgi:hypothetical protein